MKKLIVLLFLTATAFGQGGIINGIALKSNGVPASGATVRVCTSTATGTPCSPAASIYSDAALSVPKGTGGVFNSDGNGNYWFYAAPGPYKIQVTIGSSTYTLMEQVGIDGTNATVAKINGMLFAGPGSTPTIDVAVAAGSSNPNVFIAPNYSGAESTCIFTTSTGYKVCNAAANIMDLRQAQGSAGSPANTSLYPIIYRGRLAGQLTGLGVNYWTGGTIADSTAGATFFNWISGTFPSNSGGLFGSVAVAQTHDALTIGASNSEVIGMDAEALINNTSTDGTLVQVAAYSGGVGITRTNGVQHITNAAVFLSKDCTDISTVGSLIANCYGFDGAVPTGGTTRNYQYHSNGNWLTEFGTSWWATDHSSVPRKLIAYGATPSTDSIVYQPLADAQGWEWKKQDATSLVKITSSGVRIGASGSTISDSRELVQNAHSCGTTTTCANTANGSNHIVFGSVALSSASPSTATVTAISPAFTSSSTYFCTATPVGATAAIAAGGIAVTYVSGSSFTLTGPNTVTTVVGYQCIGN